MALYAGEYAGSYRVVSHLGRGGHADVYKVVHEFHGTVHALKLLHHSSHEVRQRMLREARTQSKLKHRSIVCVTDLIEHGGMTGLIMDFVEGPSLTQVMERGPMSIEDLDLLARDLLSAMAVAHDSGIVHRDLKPGNILFDDGVARICDFGIAKVLRNEKDPDHLTTRTGSALGTPAYMAPEQIRDARRVDQRADVYSLGVLLYEAATGRRAFPQQDLVALFTSVTNGELQPAVMARPDLPQKMCAVVDCALSIQPEGRYASAGVMLAVWTAEDAPSTLVPAPLDWAMADDTTTSTTNEFPIEPPQPKPQWSLRKMLYALFLFLVLAAGMLTISSPVGAEPATHPAAEATP